MEGVQVFFHYGAGSNQGLTHKSWVSEFRFNVLTFQRFDKSLRQILRDGFPSRMHMQFAVNAFNVHADCIDSDGEEVCNFLVGTSLSESIYDFFFSS